MFNVAAYTPLESFLLFQSLLSLGVTPTAFSRASSSLRDNVFIKQDTSYDATRLNPEPLQELFLHHLRDELKRETEASAKSDGSLSPNKRRKLQAPPLHTLQDALAHLRKVPALHQRLFLQYQGHQIRQIREDEERYDAVQRELKDIENEEPVDPVDVQNTEHSAGHDIGVSPEASAAATKLPNGTGRNATPGSSTGTAVATKHTDVAVSTATAAQIGRVPAAETRTSPISAVPAAGPNPPQGVEVGPPSAPPRQPSPAAGVRPGPVPAASPRPAATTLPIPETQPTASLSPQPSPALQAPPAPPRVPSPSAGARPLVPIRQASPAAASLAPPALHHPSSITSSQPTHPPRRLSPALPAQQGVPAPPLLPHVAGTASSAPPAAPSLARVGVSPPSHFGQPSTDVRGSEPARATNGAATTPVLQHPQAVSVPALTSRPPHSSQPPQPTQAQGKRGLQRPESLGPKHPAAQAPNAASPGGTLTPPLKWEPLYQPQQHATTARAQPMPPSAAAQLQPKLSPQPSWNPQLHGHAPGHPTPQTAQTPHPRPIRPQPAPRGQSQPGPSPQPSMPVPPQHSGQGQLQAPALQAPPLRTPTSDAGLVQQPSRPLPSSGTPATSGQAHPPAIAPQPMLPSHNPTTVAHLPAVGTTPVPNPPPPPHIFQTPGVQHPSRQQLQVAQSNLQQTPVSKPQPPPIGLHTAARLAAPDARADSSPSQSDGQRPDGSSQHDASNIGRLRHSRSEIFQHLTPAHVSTPKPGLHGESALSRLSLPPQTPISNNLFAERATTGSATKWKSANPTPSTPRRDDLPQVSRPAAQSLSPVIAPATLPQSQTRAKAKGQSRAKEAPAEEDDVDMLAEEPLERAGASTPTPLSAALKTRKQQVHKLDTSATPRGRGRPRGGRTADSQRHSPPTSRRSWRRSSPDELQADSEPDSARVKNEEETPRPLEETGDTTADESVPSRRGRVASSSVVSRRGKRKRADSPADDRAEALGRTPSANPAATRGASLAATAGGGSSAPRGAPPAPPTHVLWTRGFPRISASQLDQIVSHRHANMFAQRVRDRDAPGYENIVLGPMDLKSIRTAITHGNKSATAAAALLPDDDKAASTVWLPISEDLVPPKGIINNDQLDRALAHMFANAIMYNADPHRGPGPAFLRREVGAEGDAAGAGGAGGADESHADSYYVDENAVVNNTRSMFAEVEVLLDSIPRVEKPPPPPPGATVMPVHAATAEVKASVDRATTAEDDGEDAAEASVAATPSASGTGTGTVKRRRIARG